MNDTHPSAVRARLPIVEARGSYTHIVIPACVFLLIATLTFTLVYFLRADEQRNLKNNTQLAARGLANQLHVLMQEEIRPLRRLAREIVNGQVASPRQFVASADASLGPAPNIHGAAWINESGIVEAVWPARPSELMPGEPVMNRGHWGEMFKKLLTPPRRLMICSRAEGETEIQWVAMPLVDQRMDQAADKFHGGVVGRTTIVQRTRDLLDEYANRSFDVNVFDSHGRVIHTTGPQRGMSEVKVSQSIPGFATEWQLSLHPTDEFVASTHGRAPRYVLLGGLLFAGLASLAAAQEVLHRRRYRQRISDHIAALEGLTRVSGQIIEGPANSEQLLAEIAEVAARLLDMPMRVVGMVEEREESLRIIHREGMLVPDEGCLYPLAQTPLSVECMSSRKILWIESVESQRPASYKLLQTFKIEALIVMPLLVGGNATGIIALASPTTRRFSEVDRRLAELWVIEASALLSNRSLHERMETALASQQRMLEQRETLYQVNSTIQRAGSLREALDRVAELAPRALEMDACVVCLAHSGENCIQIAAVTPVDPPHSMPVDAVVECSACAGVIRSGQIRIVEDTAEMPVRGFPDMGSVLFVPLRAGAATNGLLALLRRRKGPFDIEHVQTAELFAARAAAAIESARLHDQTRRQAETNAVLLRELNHRVGNNLASIVGLLSMGASQLPSRSRQWLDRAIERVAMMARAHELFSGGVQTVELGELLRTTLSSISAVKGPDVSISIDLQTDDVKLPSSRAVTLAMVLHELAYNAIVHGLGEGGELIVRAQNAEDDRIVIQTIDRAAVGVGSSEAGVVNRRQQMGLENQHAGLGLQIVQNLVSRELRGSFELVASGDGGTIATVEFPLNESS